MNKDILVKFIYILIIVFASFFAGKVFLESVTNLDISDFHVYYYIPKMVFDMNSPTHPYTSYVPIYPYFFPPSSLLVLWPLSLVPFWISKIIWTVINFILLFISIYLILISLKRFTYFNYFVILLIGFNFHPIVFTLVDGQFNIILLFIFSLGYYFFESGKLRNFFIIATTLGIISKISPGILLFYALIKKNIRLLVYSLVPLFLIVLATEFFVDYKINYYYFKSVVPRVSEQSTGYGPREQSFSALIKRISGTVVERIPRFYQNLILYGFTFLLLVLLIYGDFKFHKSIFNNSINISLFTFISVSGTGLTWFHQYSILFLPITIMIFICIFNLKKYRLYFLASYLFILCLWAIDLFSLVHMKSYLELYMFWAGVFFLINTFYLKFNQNLFSEKDLVKDFSNSFIFDKRILFISLISFAIGSDLFNFDEKLKEGRDLTRVKEINFMKKILIKHNVSFRKGESNSFIGSNKADRGYILIDKGEYEKIIHEMRVLYLDTVNNQEYNYRFKSEGGKNFELASKLESKKFISIYGSDYKVIN
jgi:hypothetical protein